MAREHMDMLPISQIGVSPKIESAIGEKLSELVWPADTTVQMCNVPWDSEYVNVVKFDDAAARDAYFANLAGTTTTLNKLTYCIPGQPVMVDIPYHAAYKYNYLVVSNPTQPVAGEPDSIPTFYYFITDVVYIAPNTTQLVLSLDIWTTYEFDIEVGRAFVTRGHAAIHAFTNGSGTTAELQRRYLTQPEGLDVGNSYCTTNERLFTMGGGKGDAATEWTVIVCSAVDLRAEAGKLDEAYGTYDDETNKPKQKTAQGMLVGNLPSGCQVYALEVHNFEQFCTNLQDYPWISSNILSITTMPEGMIEHGTTVHIAGVAAYELVMQKFDAATADKTIENLQTFIKKNTTDKWKAQPKARIYPYTYLCMDNLCAQPVTLKPEQLYDADTLEFSCVSSICPGFQRIYMFPLYYGAGAIPAEDKVISFKKYAIGGTSEVTQNMPMGDTLNNALIWSDFAQFSILNDSYINYLASNANSLQYARDNAGWVLDKTRAYASTDYANSQRSLGAAADVQKQQYGYATTVGTATFGGALANKTADVFATATTQGSKAAANALGDLTGWTASAKTMTKYGANMANMAKTTAEVSTGLAARDVAQKQFDIQNRAARKNVDANYKLANWAAKGDYQQAIASINATCQDAQLLPPTQSGTCMGGTYAVLGALALTNWIFTSNTVLPEYQNSIADYWARFGYAINEYMVIGTEFNLMTHFTYWMCEDVIIKNAAGNMSETNRMVIKGLFEKGVTVYSDPADIEGDISILDNNAPKTSAALY